MKWKGLYDSETLVELHNLKEARFMIDARVEDYPSIPRPRASFRK